MIYDTPPEVWDEANEDNSVARIDGHLWFESCALRDILGDLPWTNTVNEIISSSQDGEYNEHDVALTSINSAETS